MIHTLGRIQSRPFGRAGSVLLGVVALGLASPWSNSASAIRLQDGSSYIDVNANVRPHVENWFHAGNDQLVELSNWYRVGSSGIERPVHTLNVVPQAPVDTNNDNVDDLVTIHYFDTQSTPRFRLEIDYYVNSNGLLGEDIRIFNIHPTQILNFHFFEYVDLDLGATTFDDVAEFDSANTLKQTDGIVTVTGSYNSTHREIDAVDTVNDTLFRLLSDGVPTTLTDTPATGFPQGPGDMSWTLQWSFTGLPNEFPSIPPGSMAQIIKHWQCTVIPEPATWMLALVAGALVAVRRRS